MVAPTSKGKYYVSITGLKLKSFFSYFTFARYAGACYAEAMSTEGNVLTETRTIAGYQHTLTAWESRSAMMKFFVSTPHRNAVKVFPSIATGKTYGYWTDNIPSWDEAVEIWKLHGREYGVHRHAKSKEETTSVETTVKTSL